MRLNRNNCDLKLFPNARGKKKKKEIYDTPYSKRVTFWKIDELYNLLFEIRLNPFID